MLTLICKGYTAHCTQQEGLWVAEVLDAAAPWPIHAWAESFDELGTCLLLALQEHEQWLRRDISSAFISTH